MRKAIIVGSGAGGATMAKELQGRFEVTILEAGNSFHPFTADLSLIEKVKKTGAFFDTRMIQAIFPTMRISKAGNKMILVKGIGHGGSTTISAGNAVRQDAHLRAVGIDLDAEFKEISGEIPISTEHQKSWHIPTRQAFEICRDMGLQPVVTPKMTYPGRCFGCGRCILGCPRGAKWDSRIFLNQAQQKGARVISNSPVRKIVVENGRAMGVIAAHGWRTRFYPADLIILAAGGLGSPVILQNSGIRCQDSLFVDPVLCVASKMDGCRQNGEIPMPFIVQKEHFIISPYFDFLSNFFNRHWRYPSGNIYSLMIKLADTNLGSISRNGVKKYLSETDLERLKEGVDICTRIFRRLGKKDTDIFLGTLNAGHPGGMLPLTARESQTFHHDFLPPNLYVADASLFPRSLGNPPILTIIAMAKRVSRICLNFA